MSVRVLSLPEDAPPHSVLQRECPLSPTRVYDDKGDERNDRSNTKKTLRQRLCVAADGWPAADDAPAATGAVRLQWERTR